MYVNVPALSHGASELGSGWASGVPPTVGMSRSSKEDFCMPLSPAPCHVPVSFPIGPWLGDDGEQQQDDF